jgi:Tol biopolymer transport system component
LLKFTWELAMTRAAGNNHIYSIDRTFDPGRQDSATAVRRISYRDLARMLPLLLLVWLASGCGVAPVVDNKPTPTPLPTPVSTPTPPPPTPTPTPAAAAKAIIFTSNRALDGTDSTTLNQPSNIWGINSDGTGLTPLTNLSDTAFFADSDDAVFSPDGTRIAFSSARAFDGSNNHDVNQVANIWLMNADGTNAKALTHLTAAKAHCVRPAWSPDGTKIAYTSARALDGSDNTNPGGVFIVTNVWSINADGTNDIPLTDDNSIFGGGTTNSSDPVWSPDGTKIIFNSARALDGTHLPSANSIPNIWIINSADGSGRLPLTFYTASGIVPTAYSWFPNSTKIVYGINAALVGDAFGIPNIWTLDTAVFPLKPTSLTNFTTTESALPSISPDGSKIAFVSTRALDGTDTGNTNNTTNIWVMNADGSSPTHLTSLTAMGPGAVVGGGRPDQIAFPWLKDGSKIAFTSSRALDGSDTLNTNFVVNIWVMNSDGSAQKPVTKVTTPNTDSSEPNWHP